ncbi:MAG: thermonuclease family protein [Ruminococcus flavefaciens]|nr:thermonuclease family protein [Ruminococcus flavefaciens]
MKEKIFLAATVIAAAAGIFCFAGDFIKSAEKIDIIDTVVPEQIKDSGKIIAEFEEIGKIIPDVSDTDLSETKSSALNNIDGIGTLVRVVDGDTYVIDTGGEEKKIRLIGVDTPESVAPADYRKENTAEGKEISDIVKDKIAEGDILYIEYDVQETDRYGRTLAYLYFPDGMMIQEWLLSNGYANVVTYQPNVKYSEHFSELAHTAMENNIGLWNGFFEETTDERNDE